MKDINTPFEVMKFFWYNMKPILIFSAWFLLIGIILTIVYTVFHIGFSELISYLNNKIREKDKEKFDAWLKINHPEMVKGRK